MCSVELYTRSESRSSGGGEIMRGFGIRHFVGVFDNRMTRIYRAIGSSPEVLGSQGEGRDQISVGLWDFTPEAQTKVAVRARISPEISKRWFDRDFGGTVRPMFAKSA